MKEINEGGTDVMVGHLIKVHLPGETPWAEVVRIVSPEVIQARLDNHPIGTPEHGLKFDDIATFEKVPDEQDTYWGWTLAPAGRQIAPPVRN